MFKCTCKGPCVHRPQNRLHIMQRQARDPETCIVMPVRASGPTAKRLTVARKRKVEIPEAEQYVRETVQGLQPDMFAEAALIGGAWFDVYGRYRDGLGWYAKLRETDDGALVISHHEPEHPLMTSAGVIEVIDPKAHATGGADDVDI